MNSAYGDSFEAKCLAQLDDEQIWKQLKRPKPDDTEPLPTPITWLIFRFNWMIFAGVFTLLFGVGAVGVGIPMRDILAADTLLPGFGLVAVLSGGLAWYTAGVYRKSWNRRARRFSESG